MHSGKPLRLGISEAKLFCTLKTEEKGREFLQTQTVDTLVLSTEEGRT
jgi:hypothetical protein